MHLRAPKAKTVIGGPHIDGSKLEVGHQVVDRTGARHEVAVVGPRWGYKSPHANVGLRPVGSHKQPKFLPIAALVEHHTGMTPNVGNKIGR